LLTFLWSGNRYYWKTLPQTTGCEGYRKTSKHFAVLLQETFDFKHFISV
jgi:hypothetical protein